MSTASHRRSGAEQGTPNQALQWTGAAKPAPATELGRWIWNLRHSTDSVCGVARQLEQRSVAVGRQV